MLVTGEARRAELRVLHQGVERAYDLTVQPLRNAAGQVDGVTCAAIDITDTKQSEEELRARNERLRLLSTIASQLVLRGQAMQTAEADEVLANVFVNLARVVRAEIHLHYRVTDPGRLRLISSSGISDETRTAASNLVFGEGLCGSVADSRARLLVEDLAVRTIGGGAFAPRARRPGLRRLSADRHRTRPRDGVVRDHASGRASSPTRSR